MKENIKPIKRKWIKPELQCLSIKDTKSGGGLTSPPESAFYAPNAS